MSILRPFILIPFFLAPYAAAEPEAEPPWAPGPSTNSNSTDFIRMNCESTLYPETCYQSLSGFAPVVQQDPARLAGVALGVSLSRATYMSFYLANLTGQADYGADPRCASALHDCFSLFRDAVSQIRDSMKQMRRLNGAGEELRFQMSNVQTWMSAALTNEDTCTDGFEEVGDGPVKTDVCDQTVEVKEVTSNALALVNSYVSKVA